MKQTAVEYLEYMFIIQGTIYKSDIDQAKAKERSQKAEEYLKGFKDGKEHQIRLDELTFGSSKQIMSTDIPFTNKDKKELMKILNRLKWQRKNKNFKSE